MSVVRARTEPAMGVAEIIDDVRTRIIRGGLAPGQRLTEERLAAECGVSRIPVREALRVLGAEGFVIAEGYKGTFVAVLSPEDARDLLDVRAVLEPLAAAQAAVRHTPDDLATLHELVERGTAASRDHRLDDVRELNARFHEHLAVASRNRTLIELMRVVRYKLEWATSIDLIERGRGQAAMHIDIVEAIAAGDPDRAADAAAAHIDASYSSRGWHRRVDASVMRGT